MKVPRHKPFTGSHNCRNSNNIIGSSVPQLPSVIVQYILRWPVISPLTFLMNDIRFKSFYRASKTTSAAGGGAAAASKSCDKSQNNNPRTYNNSSKSNKVFLHYIPRDPRLRILHRTAALNKPLNRSRYTLSELNITEDLCNYGELIGGSDTRTRNRNRNRSVEKE
ncbi:uncharacterized protein LOC111081652 [Drosophila obscura]|uniref:uncharacterized protein LOC111081652 n=1 Tax=Drosophila obscura TaxID=7282 RepID=UPI000BA034D4|nr:uncharacterized protein LOC111081652 [Drosophila obscura]XP_022233461.1 uncharacterized protein LOC111081652 [Drosophila obscura]XP_041450221.1 uncharacterized protein LOC111081652 [Drosophila obscura]